MKKILIAGSKGTIGTIIKGQLSDVEVVDFDLPEHDVRNYDDVVNMAEGSDVIIHLGWDTKNENWKSGVINPENALMTFNVYRAALEKGVKRVIMASSVHADWYFDWTGPELMDPYALPTPDSPYGRE